ncbi:MAG TPA: DNA translocase FtsK 4TM domain-containing protein, partial [Gemmataceae bacterium]|nr:DNA translocase FtsK 4TM domain-containing protein [Gemmataceae bacterium]
MALRKSRLDLLACGLLVAGLLTALSVFSQDPADGPNPSVYPAHAAPANLLGSPGARLAGVLHETLGVAIYLFLASWFVLVVMLFLRRGLLTWSRRLSGWLLLLPGAAVLADLIGPHYLPGPVSGSGGTLGAWLAMRLDKELQPAGRIAVVSACLLLGILLAADFALIRPLRWAAGACRRLLRTARPPLKPVARTPRPAQPNPRSAAEPAADNAAPMDADGIPIHHAETAAVSAAVAVPPIVRPAPAPDEDR